MADANWRKVNKTIGSRLKSAFHRNLFTDTEFLVQDREFKCHSLILSLGSPYFERAFFHPMKDRTKRSHFVFWDITPETFQCVLGFLYTDQVTFANEKIAFQTYEAATKFEMPDLKSECEIYLSEMQFHPGNVWSTWDRSVELKMERMQQKCLRYVQNHTEECVRHKTFIGASADCVLRIVKSDTLAIKEFHLLCWLAYRAAQTSGQKNLRHLLTPYLKHIRFSSMTGSEFCLFTKEYPEALSSMECLAILRFLNLREQKNLPEWCCRLPGRTQPD